MHNILHVCFQDCGVVVVLRLLQESLLLPFYFTLVLITLQVVKSENLWNCLALCIKRTQIRSSRKRPSFLL